MRKLIERIKERSAESKGGKEMGWYGVDLDGTIAEYNGWVGVDHIGDPIPKMVDRVKKWLSEGKDVRIMTARIPPQPEGRTATTRKTIELWCEKHIGQVLPITHSKDYGMIELWDDRAIQVIANTGERADGK